MNSTHDSPGSADLDEVKPELSVILSISNRSPSLARVMGSVRAQDLPLAKYELIVINEEDGDHSAYLRSLEATCSLRIIEVSHRTLGVGLNEAVAVARGSIVLFTSDNLLLHPGNFKAHSGAHETKKQR